MGLNITTCLRLKVHGIIGETEDDQWFVNWITVTFEQREFSCPLYKYIGSALNSKPTAPLVETPCFCSKHCAGGDRICPVRTPEAFVEKVTGPFGGNTGTQFSDEKVTFKSLKRLITRK